MHVSFVKICPNERSSDTRNFSTVIVDRNNDLVRLKILVFFKVVHCSRNSRLNGLRQSLLEGNSICAKTYTGLPRELHGTIIK